MGEYAGRTVVVTGAGSGLGAAMADAFAAEGANLALLDIDGERVEAKAQELRARGVDAFAQRLDVADSAALQSAAEAVRGRFGGCDVLCANVGVQQFGAIEVLTEQDWDWVLSTNVKGVIGTVAAFLPLLRTAGGQRHIVLTASSSVFQPGIRMAAYVASKFALVGYGEVLRMELADEGINVSLLFPSGMRTRHLDSSKAARPAELGESRFDRADLVAMQSSADIHSSDHVATPEHAIRNLLTDLRNNERYIITHGNYRSGVEAMQAEVIAAFKRMEAN